MQGTLRLFRSRSQLDGAAADIAILRRYGVAFELLDREGCMHAEPALRRVQEKVARGLYLPDDETGDCFKFTQDLAALAVRMGVHFRYRTPIRRLVEEDDQIDRIAGSQQAEALCSEGLVGAGKLGERHRA